MIPKTIHYCWFGRSQKPKLAEKCIKSWKKYCQDYKIIEWNEENYDISSAPLYVRQAYEAKKWAYVSDFVRLKVVYDCGGIYLDTDVEVIKPFDELLKYQAFFGFEGNEYVNTGLGFGAEKGLRFLNEIVNQYAEIPFFLSNGKFDNTPCPNRNTEVFLNYGLKQNGLTQVIKDNIIILAPEFLCPIDFSTEKKRITKNSFSIHWFSASWFTQEDKDRHKSIVRQNRKYQRNVLKDRVVHIPNQLAKQLFGQKLYSTIKYRIKNKKLR